jgi:branched-chain amino acid transport system ATP-binding protein
MPMLELQGIHTYYGHIQALKGVDVTVEQGEIVTLIGANGAGKSTLLMTICGNPRATRGKVIFEGKEITRAPITTIVRQGVQQVPEGRRIFSRMTVLENLQMGATLGDPAHYKSDLDRMFGMFPILEKRQAQRAGTLSGGEQQMLAICRALMSRPRLLMLDEPSLGLAPLIVKQIFKTIQDLNRENGTTILLVEQNAFHALKVAHRAYVLQNGEIRLQGSGQELLSNPEVRALYLEGGHHAA